MQKGNLSIHAENLLPIIKKWLYSDKDIFIRELVANGCDAVSKYAAISGDSTDNMRVKVTVDKEKRTITFSDDGIGMTKDEIDRYINNVAFSGAQEFIDKLKATGAEAENIIGHFGLGFYSAFMVSDKVIINSLSYQEGAKSAMWVSDGGLEFEMGEGTRAQRGTDVILHVSEDAEEYLEESKVREVMRQYLNFMPVSIYVGEDETPINDTKPLYLKAPGDITDDEYKEFYKKTFGTWEDPLFWVHLNIDFPFNMKGILYFPRIRQDYSINDGCVKLYCRQVFVAENIKEIIPDYLLLLKGVIDSPDIPLNVSRSFLQSDKQVKALSGHISRKAADKLTSLFKTDREQFEKVWDDISLFVKFGCMRDDKFYDRVKSCLIFKTNESTTLTIEEAKEKAKETQNSLYYVGMDNKDAPIADMYTAKGITLALLDSPIDANFISFLEMKETELKFKRVDSDVADAFKAEENDESTKEVLEKIMREAVEDDKLTVNVAKLEGIDVPAILTFDEQMRRFKENSRMWGNEFDMPIPATITLNIASSIIDKLISLPDEEKSEFAKHIYDLAELQQGSLPQNRMAEFIRRSYKFM